MIPVRHAAAAAALSLIASPVAAEGLVTILVGYGPGGSYDTVARLLATHLPEHLEGNPEVIVENVPGAGSMVLAKRFTETGKTDGSELAVISSAFALLPVFEPENTDFDPAKVHYVAAMSNESSFCVAHVSSGITTVDQLLSEPIKVGATGKNSSTYTYPAAIKSAFGAKYEIVTGFDGGEEIDLAMERGEVQVRCGIGMTSLQEGDYLSRFNVVAELAPVSRGAFPGVEFILDRATDPDLKQALSLVFSSGTIHHPIIAAPGTPDAVLESLRAAVAAAAADPDFLAEAEARKIEISVTPGDRVEEIIAGFIAAPQAVRERARELVK